MGGQDKTITQRQAKWVENQRDKNRAKLQGYISNEAKDLIYKLLKERELPNQGAVIEYVLSEWLKLQTGGKVGQARSDLEQLRQENDELRDKLQQVEEQLQAMVDERDRQRDLVSVERDRLLRERDDLKVADNAGVKEFIKEWKAKAENASGPRWTQLKNFFQEYEKRELL